MSLNLWAGGSTADRIDAATFKAAETLSFHDAIWCGQGHIQRLSDPRCPTCTIATAEIASDLLEQLHLGLIEVLEPSPVYPLSYAEQLAAALGGR